MPEWLQLWLDRANKRLDEIKALRILYRAAARYGESEASQGAASLAYYMLLSLFPLLLLLVAVASYLFRLSDASAFQQAVGFVSRAIPVSQELIATTLDTVLEKREAVGLFSLISTLWSASSAFTILSRHINAAWANPNQRGFVNQRLVAFGMVGAIALLLLLSVGATGVLQMLPGLAARPATPIIRGVVPLIFTTAMFIALYRWIPTHRARWHAVLWGSCVTAVAWELAKNLFTWFLDIGLTNYQLVYGSLGSVVALLFWIYISAAITLFGAHLTAALDHKEHADEI